MTKISTQLRVLTQLFPCSKHGNIICDNEVSPRSEQVSGPLKKSLNEGSTANDMSNVLHATIASMNTADVL
jgi:hypothetical protein